MVFATEAEALAHHLALIEDLRAKAFRGEIAFEDYDECPLWDALRVELATLSDKTHTLEEILAEL